MNNYNQNLSGIQKIKPTEVTTDGEIGMNAAMSGLQGGMDMFEKTGNPYLAGGAAVAFTAASALGGAKKKRNEKIQLAQDENYNEYVEGLAGRASRDNTYVPSQDTDIGLDTRYDMNQDKYFAPNGLNASSPDKKSKLKVEVENNELAFTKTKNGYKLKNVFPQSVKSHEEGGLDIELGPNDFVMPVKPEEFESTVARVKRYMFDDNPRTKKYLDRIYNNLPTIEEAKHNGEVMASKGVKNDSNFDVQGYLKSVKNLHGMSNYKLAKLSNEDAEKLAMNMIQQEQEGMPLSELGNEKSLNKTTEEKAKRLYDKAIQEEPGKDIFNSTIVEDAKQRMVADGKEVSNYVDPFKQIESDNEGLANKVQELRNNFGPAEPSTKDWNKLLDEGLKGTNYNKKQVFDYLSNTGYNTGTSNTYNTNNERYYGNDATSASNQRFKYQKPITKTVDDDDDDDDTSDNTTKKGGTVGSNVDDPVLARYDSPQDSSIRNYQMDDIPNFNNPLKYASVLNNYATGQSEAEKATRNYPTLEEQKYKDYSGAQRAEIQKQNTYAQLANTQNVDRSLSHSKNSQSAAQALSAMEEVNEKEARIAFETDKYNTQMRNQYSANRASKDDAYDIIDSQNEAARKRYEDTAYSEMATLAQLSDQQKYMKAKDEQIRKIQMASLGLIGSDNFQSTYENGQFNTRYIGNDNINGNVERGYKADGKGNWINTQTGKTYSSITGKLIG